MVEEELFRREPGQVDWDEPSDVVHRGVNIGQKIYEEISIVFLDSLNAVAQPRGR